jgi:hypothetical protein
LKIVVKLAEPLFNIGYTLWMSSCYSSPSLCSLLRDSGVIVADTVHLNRKLLPQLVKSKMLAEGEFVAAECSGIMVMKWRDERSVIHIHVP